MFRVCFSERRIVHVLIFFTFGCVFSVYERCLRIPVDFACVGSEERQEDKINDNEDNDSDDDEVEKDDEEKEEGVDDEKGETEEKGAEDKK